MNWTRGLTRLGGLGGLAWGAYVHFLIWDITANKCNWMADCSSLWLKHSLFVAANMVAGAIALYIIGAALVWALRGFRQGEPQA